MLYSVKQVAKRVNISEHTLRYYDRQGLMPFLQKNANGNRLFSEDDICNIELIKCLKKSNMSIQNIKEYIILSTNCCETSEVRKKLLEKQRDFIINEIALLEQSLCEINYRIINFDEPCSECI